MHFADSQTTAIYFFWFSLSLAFWSAQALYARAFYAAGDTLTPMIASSIVTAASIPMYAALYHTFSTRGLAIASDLGIVANTLVIAILLHRRKLVPANEFKWGELGKALITAAFAGVLSYFVAKRVIISHNHLADLYSLALVSLTWAAAVALGLWLTKSRLPGDLRRRRGVVYPRVAEREAEEISRGAEP
jgi:putative peptidoglycan lipid II flippase